MARPRKPWFRASTGWWMVEINGRQKKLVHGFENKTAAEQKFHAFMAEVLDNPPLDAGRNRLTVLSLLDGYLDHFKGALAARTWYERKRIIDRFGQFCVDRKPGVAE